MTTGAHNQLCKEMRKTLARLSMPSVDISEITVEDLKESGRLLCVIALIQ
jgi:hypothetical protein